MNAKTFQSLEFNKIKCRISDFALTDSGKNMINEMKASQNLNQICSWMDEVEEAVGILEKSTSVPIHALDGIERLLEGLNKGVALRPDHLTKIYYFLDACHKLKRFMKDKEFLAPRVTTYVYSIEDLPELAAEIQRCIRNGTVDDYASKELLKVRKQISIGEERLKEKVQHILKSKKYKPFLQENIVSLRGGRFVVPIKKEYKGKIKGTILDTSASGSTVYVEPEEVALQQDQIQFLKMEEEAVIDQVLFYLTGLVEQHQKTIKIAVETMVHYDVLFAKAKYGRFINGRKVLVNDSGYIRLKNARHPLLGKDAIPLTLEVGKEQSALIITGPNTGGKTVTIKTVGLLTLMVQCGLLIPTDEGTEVSIYQKILLDIGDGQSIEQNLSTFSSHIQNIIEILKMANENSLVLLDEVGSGTDPSEGMGLATAILKQLYEKGVTLFATTHYSEIKEYAEQHEGFINGSMEFNLETLKPTYRLQLGKGGDSQAFAIALKLGMHPKIIENAHYFTYKETKAYDHTYLDDREIEKQVIVNRYAKKKKAQKEPIEKVNLFKLGDNVQISTGENGIVYNGPDSTGNYVVQVKGKKETYNHKRLKLYISAEEMYPDGYDFDIVFKSKENRKKANRMKKKHIEGLTIEEDN
ncbi:MutS2 family protein [Bacillus pakistanensis]|uniref:MutS2 family protein n=1 Tax=Rossellomorea pakistanensis TaxID=992288 RepID=A0ABS2N8B7_9BACI|nr:endonuclease MutS2 [Bacillus pakistanensis]MBM7584097.1 MutS2 family protein [Bacillus pakistanensis]